jgi:hypothetical protein
MISARSVISLSLHRRRRAMAVIPVSAGTQITAGCCSVCHIAVTECLAHLTCHVHGTTGLHRCSFTQAPERI